MTYLSFWPGFCKQGTNDGDDERDAGQNESEVQVMHLSEDARPRVRLVVAAVRRRVAEVDSHTTQARHQPGHQPVPCSLEVR